MYSRAYPTHSEDDDDDESNEDEEEEEYTNNDEDAVRETPKPRKGKRVDREDMKKPVFVDAKGEPYGSMAKVFYRDVQLMAKDFDPRHNWEGQSREDKDRFFRRVYSGMCCAYFSEAPLYVNIRHVQFMYDWCPNDVTMM